MLIGVWLQKIESFRLWQARGVNTLVGWKSDQLTKLADWLSAARAAGLNYIIEAPSDPAVLANLEADPHCLGYLLDPDEPDGGAGVGPIGMQQRSAALRALGAKKPIMISFDSYNMIWKSIATYLEYAKACDWAGEDMYPANQGCTIADKLTRIRLFKALGRKVLTFVECSDQGLKWPGSAAGKPTPDSLKAQLTALSIEGVHGVIYFPQKDSSSGEFIYDNTTPEMAAAVTEANRWLGAAPPPPPLPTISFIIAAAGYQPAPVVLKPNN